MFGYIALPSKGAKRGERSIRMPDTYRFVVADLGKRQCGHKIPACLVSA